MFYIVLIEKIFIIYCWNVFEKGNIIYLYMWDYLECFIVIMMDVFVDLVYGKVILFIKIYENVNWYYDIWSFLIWVILLILVIDVV